MDQEAHPGRLCGPEHRGGPADPDALEVADVAGGLETPGQVDDGVRLDEVSTEFADRVRTGDVQRVSGDSAVLADGIRWPTHEPD